MTVGSFQLPGSGGGSPVPSGIIAELSAKLDGKRDLGDLSAYSLVGEKWLPNGDFLATEGYVSQVLGDIEAVLHNINAGET